MRRYWEKLLTLMWGARVIRGRTVAQVFNCLVTLEVHADDTHSVVIYLDERYSTRTRGPKWARKHRHVDYMVGWACRDGIVVNRHPKDGYCMTQDSWTYLGDIKAWEPQVIEGLKRHVYHERIRNRYFDLPSRNRRA